MAETTRSRRSRSCSPRRSLSDVTTVWVYAEVRPEGPSPSALELLTRAREIGDEVAAVALGPGATASAPALGEHGATVVYASDDAVYADALGQPAAHALARLGP